MRPVNLLPEGDRPRQRAADGTSPNRAYPLLGVLGALLVMVTLYVLTANQVTSREDKAAQVAGEADRAEAKAKSLSPFGDFAQTAQTRTAAVKQLAEGRFDWERLLRELSLVLPADTWLTEADAATLPGEGDGGTDTAQPTVNGPSAKLKGCAKRQPSVAKLMLRLRRMHRVEDVLLQESATGDSSGEAGASGGASSSDCGRAYAFDITVVFTATPPASALPPGRKRVPVSLGGGQ